MASLADALAREHARAAAILHAEGARLAGILARRPPPLGRMRRLREALPLVLFCAASAGYAAEASACLGLCRALRGDAQLSAALRGCAHGQGRRTRLMHAARTNNAARIAFLLPGATVDAADADGRTALHHAAAAGAARAARALLAAGAGTGAAAPGGVTPLHCACAAESLPVVLALLAAGADASAAGAWHDARSLWGGPCQSTPLGIACVTGQAAVARALLRAGACANGVQHADGSHERLDGKRTCGAAVCLFGRRDGSLSSDKAWMAQVCHMTVMGDSSRGWGGDEPVLRYSPLEVAVCHENLGVVRALLEEGRADFCNCALARATGSVRALLEEHFKELLGKHSKKEGEGGSGEVGEEGGEEGAGEEEGEEGEEGEEEEEEVEEDE